MVECESENQLATVELFSTFSRFDKRGQARTHSIQVGAQLSNRIKLLLAADRYRLHRREARRIAIRNLAVRHSGKDLA